MASHFSQEALVGKISLQISEKTVSTSIPYPSEILSYCEGNIEKG